jgi:hypothetical protein
MVLILQNFRDFIDDNKSFESNDISFLQVLEWRLITSKKKSGHRNYRSWNGWALDATNIITR